MHLWSSLKNICQRSINFFRWGVKRFWKPTLQELKNKICFPVVKFMAQVGKLVVLDDHAAHFERANAPIDNLRRYLPVL